ncbi:MAG TPA: hypothetical protein VHM02_05855 [Thermoanaerobaculia bacterium]|nr:hypothetical protein [Thermoanaerobaculia bacterium]
MGDPWQRADDEAEEPAARPLRHRLREAGGEELAALLAAGGEPWSPEEALAALANPHLDGRGVERLAARAPLGASREVARAVALHPRAPEALARRLLPGLPWRDLVAAGRDVRLAPVVRRAADLLLAERLPGLSAGERTSIARGAGPGLVARFRDEADPRVVAALLDNPRLTEGALLPMISRQRAAPAALAAVAADRRWGVRAEVRRALARNPATPVAVALRLLPHLAKADLSALARDLRLAPAVRRRAMVLAGEATGGA